MRRKLVAGVYRVISPETVAGKRILLVDDIITTGSTLEEAAGTLRAGGGGRGVLCDRGRGRHFTEMTRKCES